MEEQGRRKKKHGRTIQKYGRIMAKYGRMGEETGWAREIARYDNENVLSGHGKT